MKSHILSRVVECLLLSGVVFAVGACSNDDQNQGTAVDPTKIAAAPESVKTICEQVCTVADQIQSKQCGTVEFATHVECYNQCVNRYLQYPNCVGAFDESNACVRDAVCKAQSQCTGDIVLAAACMQAFGAN